MDNYGTPLGPLGLLVIPLSIGLVFAFDSFWIVVSVGVGVGLLIANIRAVLFVGRVREQSKANPDLELQNAVNGGDASVQIRFIAIQSVIGGIVFGLWAGATAGVIWLVL